MKQILFTVVCMAFAISAVAQDEQSTAKNKYRLRPRVASQDTVYFPIRKEKHVLKAGWVVTETKGGVTFQRTLLSDTAITVTKDSAVTVRARWKISEVKHTNDAPEKLFLNPYPFSKDTLLNTVGYIKIPGNRFVGLNRTYVRVSAITIPFALRPRLNDTIGSKITTDLKIGASISYNLNREFFKNRRLEAKKSVYGASFGVGFGFSKVTLDKSSTSLLPVPYTQSEDGLAFFVNPGIGLNLKGFQIVGFYGWDLRVTNNVRDWNYNNKGYFGIGLGVALSTLGKL